MPHERILAVMPSEYLVKKEVFQREKRLFLNKLSK